MNQVRTYIYRKKHKSSKVSWIVRWKDRATGIWKSMSAGPSKDEALYMEAEVRKSLFQGQNPRPELPVYTPALTISELIDLLYKSHRYLSASPEWQKALRGKYENSIRPTFGSLPFTELKKDCLYRFYMELKTKGRSHSTIQKYHYKLTILGDIYCDLNPSAENGVRKIRDFNRFFPKQPPTRNIDFLVPEELEKLFVETKQSKSPLLYPLIKLLAHTGLRRSEALKLKWTDVDLDSGFVHIRKSKNGSSRVIPLEGGAITALGLLSKNNEFIFSRPNGSRQRLDSFRLPLQRAAKRAGIKKRVDLHCLRHSYGSNKIRAGWGLRKVSAILGHSDIGITSKVYTHLLDGDLKVRDNFSFDNESEKENSIKSRSAEGGTGFVAVFLKKLALLPQNMLENLDMSKIVSDICHEMQPHVVDSQVSSTLENKQLPAPLMLRKGQNSPQNNFKTDEKNKNSLMIKGSYKFGADRDRTDDLELAKLALYQLSYGPL